MDLKKAAVPVLISLVLAGCRQAGQSGSLLPYPSSDPVGNSPITLDAPSPSTPIPLPESPASASEPEIPSSASGSPTSEEPEAGNMPDASSPTILPSAETVLFQIEQQQIKLSDILEDPDGFYLRGSVLNNSTIPIIYSRYPDVERYDGEKWVKLTFKDDIRNFTTGNGDFQPGEKGGAGLNFWRFEEELTPGQYRLAIGVSPGFDYDISLPDFHHLYANFEII